MPVVFARRAYVRVHANNDIMLQTLLRYSGHAYTLLR